MVAVPSAEMLDVPVSLFDLSEQSFLKLSVWHEFDRCSFGVRSSGKKISNNDPVEAMLAVGLASHIEIADILSALFARRVALKLVKNVFLNVGVKNDLTIRREVQ